MKWKNVKFRNLSKGVDAECIEISNSPYDSSNWLTLKDQHDKVHELFIIEVSKSKFLSKYFSPNTNKALVNIIFRDIIGVAKNWEYLRESDNTWCSCADANFYYLL